MVNDTTKNKSVQKRKSPTQQLKEKHKELADQRAQLATIQEALGYGALTVEQFLNVRPDIDNEPEKATQILDLQNQYQALQEEKNSLEQLIFIEPSKLHETVNAAEKLLIKHRECHVYQRSGRLVRIINTSSLTQNKTTIVRRSDNIPLIKDIEQTHLTMLLTELGTFTRLDKRSETINKIDCPEKIARSLIAKQEWNLPILIGIINTPTLRTDGSILDTPGYDEASGLLLIAGECHFEKIPEHPTLEDVKAAKESLLFILKEFPFDSEISRAVVIAAILTALIRKSLPTAPMFGFNAPKMSSGKTLLADVVALIATGKSNSVIAQSENETEEKKRLMAVLSEGDPIVCYDNIERPFGSAALCAVLTQEEYKDRVLGVSETRTVLTNATFLATGNNLTFIGDISTRTLLCTIDPPVERPEERSFELDLRRYIPEHRAQLVQAGLIILRAYHIAGRPKQDLRQFGRFEAWSDFVRSAIVWIGMHDPCESRKEIENNDPIRILWGHLLYVWHEIFGDRSIKVREIITIINKNPIDEIHEPLKEAAAELASNGRDSVNQRVLAKKLVSFKNRIENGYRLEHMGTHQGTALWRVKKVSS